MCDFVRKCAGVEIGIQVQDGRVVNTIVAVVVDSTDENGSGDWIENAMEVCSGVVIVAVVAVGNIDLIDN